MSWNKIRLQLLLLCCLSIGHTEETKETRYGRTGQGAGYGSRDATVLSMLGWGLGMGAAIAAICALIPNSEASTSHTAH